MDVVVAAEPGAPVLGEQIEMREPWGPWISATVVNHGTGHFVAKAGTEWPRALMYGDEGRSWRRPT